MKSRGMNHFGLMTHDIDKTIDFYRDILEFEPIAYYIRELEEGHLRQVFFDLGNGQSLEFAQNHGSSTISDDFDAGMNDGLGIGKLYGVVGMIHFAFDVESVEELNARKEKLEAVGVEVFGPLDLDWLDSIYFYDPNGIQLEFAYTKKFPPGDNYFEAAKSDQWKELAKVG